MRDLDYHGWIARESDAFASVLETGDLDARVPGCPEWSLRELAWHLGRVQRFWAARLRVGADIEPDSAAGPTTGPDDAPDLAAWVRDSTRELLDALRATAPDTPAWVWWRDNRTAGAIARHQVQEAAVHRWDAQSAVGTPDPIDGAVADDGVDEFVSIARQLREAARATFVASGSGRTSSASDEPPLVTVYASASDLVLMLYGRISPDRAQVEGDRATLDQFLMPIG